MFDYKKNMIHVKRKNQNQKMLTLVKHRELMKRGLIPVKRQEREA